jgi:hypothetical protein
MLAYLCIFTSSLILVLACFYFGAICCAWPVAELESTCRFGLPPVRHADGFTRYSGVSGTEYAHEAGFDAFMTGAAYAGLLSLTKAAEALPPQPDADGSTASEPPATADAPALMAWPVQVCFSTCHGNPSVQHSVCDSYLPLYARALGTPHHKR